MIRKLRRAGVVSFAWSGLLASVRYLPRRLEAYILSGQIKNDLDFRVCGRADNVLPQIILDNTGAAEQIPKAARGRFITGVGTVFRG